MNTNSQVNVPAALLDGFVQYAEISSLTAKRALDEIGAHRQGQQKAASLRPALLAHMVEAGVIPPQQKEAADAMLAGHAETLQLLKAAVDKIKELRDAMGKQASDNGTGVDPHDIGLDGNAGHHHTKAGEYNSLTSPMVGAPTSFVKESDRPLLALINK